jgi:small-conductance mechanosensitive channel
MILATVGIEISPLLAGLGLGGLAVALALQPLLANIFASSYLLSDQSIRIGDAIQVQGGPSGTIEDIGWRATRIRSSDHNLVIVPNAVLAQATMTNFDANAPATDVTLTIRVSAEDDLEAVEEACLDELSRLCEEATDLVIADAPPSFRYQAVVDGKVEVLLRIRAASWREVGDLRHRMIVRIHGRLQSEGVALV